MNLINRTNGNITTNKFAVYIQKKIEYLGCENFPELNDFWDYFFQTFNIVFIICMD